MNTPVKVWRATMKALVVVVLRALVKATAVILRRIFVSLKGKMQNGVRTSAPGY